jgi:hypothetical protein
MGVADSLPELVRTSNPDYEVRHVVNVFPFRLYVEMIGDTAGRIYLREQDRLTVVTASDTSMRELRDALTAALEAGYQGG